MNREFTGLERDLATLSLALFVITLVSVLAR
jgi:hypothetical protein